jgi:hypothetical protein
MDSRRVGGSGSSRVESKVYLANQRTFIKWLHISILLSSLSLGLYNANLALHANGPGIFDPDAGVSNTRRQRDRLCSKPTSAVTEPAARHPRPSVAEPQRRDTEPAPEPEEPEILM